MPSRRETPRFVSRRSHGIRPGPLRRSRLAIQELMLAWTVGVGEFASAISPRRCQACPFPVPCWLRAWRFVSRADLHREIGLGCRVSLFDTSLLIGTSWHVRMRRRWHRFNSLPKPSLVLSTSRSLWSFSKTNRQMPPSVHEVDNILSKVPSRLVRRRQIYTSGHVAPSLERNTKPLCNRASAISLRQAYGGC